MAVIAICGVLYLVANLWLLFKISRVSWIYAIGSLFFFPLAVLFLVTHWGDEHDIRLPLLVMAIVASVAGFQVYRLSEASRESGAASALSLRQPPGRPLPGAGQV